MSVGSWCGFVALVQWICCPCAVLVYWFLTLSLCSSTYLPQLIMRGSVDSGSSVGWLIPPGSWRHAQMAASARWYYRVLLCQLCGCRGPQGGPARPACPMPSTLCAPFNNQRADGPAAALQTLRSGASSRSCEPKIDFCAFCIASSAVRPGAPGPLGVVRTRSGVTPLARLVAERARQRGVLK
jgi:hypothetical protein